MAAKKIKTDFDFKFNIIKGVKFVSVGDVAKKHNCHAITIRRAIERREMETILWRRERLIEYNSYLAWEAAGLQEGKI